MSERSPRDLLDEREREVLDALARGLTIEGIANDLGVSERSVQYAIQDLYKKLDACDRFTLGVRAVQLGLIPLDESEEG